MKFSTYINGQQGGPYTLDELRSLGLDRSVQVCKEGTEIWQRADDFEELAELWVDGASKKKKRDRKFTETKVVDEISTVTKPQPIKEPTLNAEAFKRILIGTAALIALFFLINKLFQNNDKPTYEITSEKVGKTTPSTEKSDTRNPQKMYDELITEGVDAYGSDKLGLAFEKFSAASVIRIGNQLNVSELAMDSVYKKIMNVQKDNAQSDIIVLRNIAKQSFLIAQQIKDTEEVRKELEKLN